MSLRASSLVVSMGYGVKGDDSLDDITIATRVVQGDREAFRHLVSAHKDAVFALLMRQVGDSTVAEDLTQDTFVKAYRGLKSFRGESTFRTWITRIAINTMNTYFQSRHYKQQRATETLDPTKHDRPGESREEDTVRVSLFRKALASLSPKLRDTLVLCGLEGKRYDEASEILGIPTGTVRSRLNKARLLMRDEVERTLKEKVPHESE